MAGREGKRGECQTGLVFVWRETGAVRNACPSRGQAASTRKKAKWNESRVATDDQVLETAMNGRFYRKILWEVS